MVCSLWWFVICENLKALRKLWSILMGSLFGKSKFDELMDEAKKNIKESEQLNEQRQLKFNERQTKLLQQIDQLDEYMKNLKEENEQLKKENEQLRKETQKLDRRGLTEAEIKSLIYENHDTTKNLH